MGSKRDWNDMSDDSSEDEQNVSLEEIQHITGTNELIQPPTLAKIVSSPLPEKKSISNQEENLKKLENCPNQNVWLYIPLFYKNNVEEIDDIINQQQNFQKKEKFIKGWNVVVSKEDAQKLIVEGIKVDRFFLKFYFSNKNDEIPKRHVHNDKKTKYVPKSPRDNNNFKSPTNLRKVVSQIEPQNTNKNLKSPSYKNKSYHEQKQKSIKTYKPKYIQKKLSEQQKSGQQQNKNQELQSPKKIMKKQSTKIQKVQNLENDNFSSNTTGEVQKKKKNKKKNSNHVDPNNPYTFF